MIDLSPRDLEIILSALIDLRNRLATESSAYTVHLSHDEVDALILEVEEALND